MSQPPPPPPPPHGENPRTTAGGSGLPPGKYDVFIIPEHSAGSGFLYLPSLKPQWNSFAAGVVSTLAVGAIVNLASPVVVRLLSGPDRSWSLLWATVVACVGVAAFLLGRHQNESSGQQNGEGSGPRGYQRPGGGYDGSRSWYTPPPHNGPPPNQAPPPPPPPPPPPQNDAPRDGGGPYQSWQDQPRPQPQPEPQAQPQPPPEPQREKPQPKPDAQPQSPPPPQPSATKTETPKGAWEKAREEMRRREEERKAKEAEAKRKEESARRLRELREKEAKERERREKEAREREALKEKLRQEQEARERERLEKELREKLEREMREKAEKEAKEREARLKEEARKREEERARAEKERQAAREREAREARERREREERAARLRKEEEEKEKNARKGSTYAFSSVGEKTSMWPNGKPPNPAPSATSAPSTPKPASPAPPSPTKPSSPTKPAPSTTTTTTTTTGTGDGYSFRPYDQPKKPTARKKSVSDFSESSWAPSASTARTTPPPSTRGPYTTSDPQKIIIRAVYGYLNQFSKTPASQLVSGVPPVTDGLILRVTSAGLFVDDDVRGVAQREWDVKAWTLKLVEVWCPVHAVHAAAATPGSVPTNHPFFKTMPASARRGAERGATKTLLGEEAVAYIDEFGRVCDGACRRGRGAASASGSSEEWKGRGLHLLRATIRDQEGKRFVFVVGEDEAWKIAGGLAALRGSSQVRALGVAGFSSMEARTLLDSLGWGA